MGRCLFIQRLGTFFTVMMPSCVSFSVMMSNISVPSPSMIRYSTSAFFPVSASVAFTLPIAVPTGEDSRTRRWMVSAKYIEKGEGEGERDISIEYSRVNCV